MLEGLIQTQDETLEKILLKMIDEKGVPMKTHIKNPLALSKLELLAKVLRLEGAIDVADILDAFIQMYRVNMVSFDRKSRTEIISAIEGLKRDERTLADKLISKESQT